MYSKSELQKLKTKFWTSFGQFSQLKRNRLGLNKKWLLYKTDIKGLELKFNFENKNCIVAIEIDLSQNKAEGYINKIKLLKDDLSVNSTYELLLEKKVLAESHKPVYHIFFEKENLSFKNQKDWPEIFTFFFDQMLMIEEFMIENKEILKN